MSEYFVTLKVNYSCPFIASPTSPAADISYKVVLSYVCLSTAPTPTTATTTTLSLLIFLPVNALWPQPVHYVKDRGWHSEKLSNGAKVLSIYVANLYAEPHHLPTWAWPEKFFKIEFNFVQDLWLFVRDLLLLSPLILRQFVSGPVRCGAVNNERNAQSCLTHILQD